MPQFVLQILCHTFVTQPFALTQNVMLTFLSCSSCAQQGKAGHRSIPHLYQLDKNETKKPITLQDEDDEHLLEATSQNLSHRKRKKSWKPHSARATNRLHSNKSSQLVISWSYRRPLELLLIFEVSSATLAIISHCFFPNVGREQGWNPDIKMQCGKGWVWNQCTDGSPEAFFMGSQDTLRDLSFQSSSHAD